MKSNQTDKMLTTIIKKVQNYLCKTMNKHKGFLFDAQP